MPIRTSIQPRQIWKNSIAAVACAGFGVWGLYDYLVTIPAREQAFADHRALTAARDSIEAKRAKAGALSAVDISEYERINQELATRFKAAPAKVEAYDRPVQLWVYVVGCGILGTPFFIWPLISLRKKQFSLEDDGTLRFPEGECHIDQVASIDMGRWMAKSIAVVTLPSGTQSILDDYKYKNLDLIIGAIASRLHPDEWTAEAKPVKKSGDEPADEPEEEAEDEAGDQGDGDSGDQGGEGSDGGDSGGSGS